MYSMCTSLKVSLSNTYICDCIFCTSGNFYNALSLAIFSFKNLVNGQEKLISS